MPNNHGIIVHFNEAQRSEYLRDIGTEGFSFSDALSVCDWEIKQIQLAFLCFLESEFHYLSLSVRGKKVATAKYRVEFSDLLDLGSIQLNEIENLVGDQLRPHFVRVIQGSGSSIPQKTLEGILQAVKTLRPNLESEIDRLISKQELSGYRITGGVGEKLLQEREAVGAALDIFGRSNELRKNVLKSWAPEANEAENRDEQLMTVEIVSGEGRSKSILAGLSTRYISEEAVLQQDLYNWDAQRADFHEFGVSSFQQGGRELEIVYANRNKIENTLGVDLIYHNLKFSSFVLVQYKLMKENASDGYVYRPEGNFFSELKRMNDFMARPDNGQSLSSHEEFRLLSDGFFFKLVPNRGFSAASGDLVSSMHITRKYMNFLVGDLGPTGPKGGRVISFKNSPRYLTNTEFTSMVNNGWIGTNNTDSQYLREFVSHLLGSGNSVIVAVEQDTSNK